MTWLIGFYELLLTWGSFIGLGFDIAGASLVYLGVRISLVKALELEAPAVPMTIGDIGGPDLVQKANTISNLRARERIRAKNYALIGLGFFILGFLLQGIGSWPD